MLLPHVIGACHAVAYAHSRGVIHRDVKPSNIMVGPFGETVVVDWGLAKERGEAEEVVPLPPSSAFAKGASLTVEGKALGTPGYMSPEQARGDVAAIDARSDVFSLGAILYELLTGRRPFEGANGDDILENVRAGKFPPVRVLEKEAPPELAAIAERSLRPDPADRYPDAAALAQELSSYATGGRVRAYQYGAWELLRKFASTHRALLGGAAIAVCALAAAAVVVTVQLHLTRIDLARSFVERAYRAEREGDWPEAAAFFAAARVQHDTSEERWGLAVASERVAERILSLRGPAELFADVGVLPDGRVLAVGHALDRLEVREAESGKTLWKLSGEPVVGTAFVSAGVLRLAHADGFSFRDAATGRELQRWLRSSGYPCLGGYPPPAATLNGQLLRLEEGRPPRPIAADASPYEFCVVSQDGRQAAYYGASYNLILVSLDDGRKLARRDFTFVQGFGFSRHGLVVFRNGSIEVMGGPGGDFTVELPESRFSPSSRFSDNIRGSAVSPDGDLVAITSSRATTQSVVVDLRSRSIRGFLHHAPGQPRLAFSPDGQRIFAAGMNNASLLSGWRLRAGGPAQDATLVEWRNPLRERAGRSVL